MANTVNLDVAQTLNIICRRGDTFRLTMELTDSNGDPIVTSDFTYLMQVRTDAFDDSNSPIINDTEFTIQATQVGELIITCPASTMASIASGSYFYDLQTTASDGTVQTWLQGSFEVIEDTSF
jgi:hypothetical protein